MNCIHTKNCYILYTQRSRLTVERYNFDCIHMCMCVHLFEWTVCWSAIFESFMALNSIHACSQSYFYIYKSSHCDTKNPLIIVHTHRALWKNLDFTRNGLCRKKLWQNITNVDEMIKSGFLATKNLLLFQNQTKKF